MPKQNIVIVSGPSGAGKSTIVTELKKRDSRFRFTVSATTRKMRKGEVDGKDYFFISTEEFKKKIAEGEFIEWENVHGQLYGTPYSQLSGCSGSGEILLMDIDVKGALHIKMNFAGAQLIFIEPKSIEVLKKRLKGRMTESSDDIETRLQRVEEEMAKKNLFDYCLINDDLTQSIDKTYRFIINKIGR